MKKILGNLKRLFLAVLAVWMLWTAVTHPNQHRTYCGTCAGHRITHRVPHHARPGG